MLLTSAVDASGPTSSWLHFEMYTSGGNNHNSRLNVTNVTVQAVSGDCVLERQTDVTF